MNQTIAQRLYEHRKSRGLSQEELAARIGVSRQAVSKWERGETSPDTENLIALAQVYGVSLDDLVLGHATPAPEAATADTVVEVSPAGIHVADSKRGENVRVDWHGVHVDVPDTQVHVDRHGVFVRENGHIHTPQPKPDTAIYRFFHKFPYPILTVIAYLLFGYLEICGGWAYGWLVFLTIPLYYTLVDAIARRDGSHFAYPVLVAFLYLWIGFARGLWHPGWLLFLTVPLYYFLCEFAKKAISKGE